MVHVIARIQAQSGKRAELLTHFRQLVPKVHAEEGCIEYGPAVDVETGIEAQQKLGDDVFMVVEKWESVEHLNAHLAAPHMDEYREAVKDLISGVILNVLEPA